MNLTQLATALAERHGLSKRDATQYIRTIAELIVDHLRTTGAGVSIAGFGTFRVALRKARTWRNPRTGQPVAIPDLRSIAFRPVPMVVKNLNAQAPKA